MAEKWKINLPVFAEIEDAFELTAMVHGEEEAQKAEASAKALFGSGSAENMPTCEIGDEVYNDGVVDVITLLVQSGLVPSRSEGRRAIEQGGVSVEGEKIADIKQAYTKEQVAAGFVLKRGKKKFVRIVAK